MNFEEERLQDICLSMDLTRIRTARDLPRSLRLHEEGSLHVYYAPFGLLPPRRARIVIVGLTPGFQQAFKAYHHFQSVQGDLEAFAKLMVRDVVYAGSTRSCLIAYLDQLGIPEALKIPTSASLFAEHADLLMPCSMLRYPVFTGPDLRNYGGSDAIHKKPFIQSMIHDIFIPFLRAQNPEALIVPMGKYPARVLSALAEQDPALEKRTLFGFPHTSGSNGHRQAQFARGLDDFRSKVQTWARHMS